MHDSERLTTYIKTEIKITKYLCEKKTSQALRQPKKHQDIGRDQTHSYKITICFQLDEFLHELCLLKNTATQDVKICFLALGTRQ